VENFSKPEGEKTTRKTKRRREDNRIHIRINLTEIACEGMD
jgi:hypothetical protein